MSSKIEVANAYLEYLAQGDMEKFVALFSKGGWVDSPLYGRQLAKDFYPSLQSDTQLSVIELEEIFESPSSSNMAIYFTYHWTLKSGKKVQFDVVDILSFDDSHKITSLRIIYDTVVSRQLVEEL